MKVTILIVIIDLRRNIHSFEDNRVGDVNDCLLCSFLLVSTNRTIARINAIIVAIILLLYIPGKKEWNTVIAVTVGSYKLTFVFHHARNPFTIFFTFSRETLSRVLRICFFTDIQSGFDYVNYFLDCIEVKQLMSIKSLILYIFIINA